MFYYVITMNEANKSERELHKRIRGKRTIIIRKLYYYKKNLLSIKFM